MSLIDILALLVVLAATFSYINQRWLRWPKTIGLMTLSMSLSGLLLVVGNWWPGAELAARVLLDNLQFDRFVMQWLLSFLLFAGAMQVSLEDLLRLKWEVALLATVSVVLSTVLVGTMTWWVLNELGIGMPLIYCLVFGALISPTDPIAVLGIIKELKAPKSLETIIAGESLFNDGMAVTMVTLLMGIALGDQQLGITGTVSLFLHEVVGGIAFGWVLGWCGTRLIQSVDDYNTEVLITVAMAMGGYTAASGLGVSGPIAITVTGIVFGNQGRTMHMSRTTRLYLDHFWEIVDDTLNGILFVLIGLELVALASRGEYLAAIAGVIPIALISRMISVVVPVGLLRGVRQFPPKLVETLTWGGLRGGVSIALALSLPKGPERETILHMAYGIVVFSILVQGLTLRRFISASDD